MTVALLKYYERNQQKSQTKFMKTGYNIRTWRMRLVCPEPIWLDRTEEYFQNVVEFYYHLLRQHEELWNSSLFDIQRSLELLTLAGRDGRQPTNPLPMGKVPETCCHQQSICHSEKHPGASVRIPREAGSQGHLF